MSEQHDPKRCIDCAGGIYCWRGHIAGLEAERDRLREYATHDKECDEANICGWSPEDGYHIRPYRGNEYKTKERPKCSCGLSTLLPPAGGA